jgi:hypothetical protein
MGDTLMAVVALVPTLASAVIAVAVGLSAVVAIAGDGDEQ